MLSTLEINFGERNTLRTNTTAEVNLVASIEKKSWGEFLEINQKEIGEEGKLIVIIMR